jgi:hypothetical protein
VREEKKGSREGGGGKRDIIRGEERNNRMIKQRR